MTGTAHGEPAAGPSGSGTVVLELRPGTGALILQTPAEMDGAEVDISLAGEAVRRTHAQVRPRHVAGGTRYAAVYPDLRPGRYTIWRADGQPAGTVTVTCAAISTVTWPGG